MSFSYTISAWISFRMIFMNIESSGLYFSASSETQGQSVGPGEKARRKFSSTGGRVLENVRRAFSLMETICQKICSKSSLKSAKSPLPVDMRPPKSTLLFKSSTNNHCSKKWEILCTAPSTENPRKLLISTNTLKLSYPVI